MCQGTDFEESLSGQSPRCYDLWVLPVEGFNVDCHCCLPSASTKPTVPRAAPSPGAGE
jgi:hypothetical protein